MGHVVRRQLDAVDPRPSRLGIRQPHQDIRQGAHLLAPDDPQNLPPRHQQIARVEPRPQRDPLERNLPPTPAGHRLGHEPAHIAPRRPHYALLGERHQPRRRPPPGLDLRQPPAEPLRGRKPGRGAGKHAQRGAGGQLCRGGEGAGVPCGEGERADEEEAEDGAGEGVPVRRAFGKQARAADKGVETRRGGGLRVGGEHGEQRGEGPQRVRGGGAQGGDGGARCASGGAGEEEGDGELEGDQGKDDEGEAPRAEEGDGEGGDAGGREGDDGGVLQERLAVERWVPRENGPPRTLTPVAPSPQRPDGEQVRHHAPPQLALLVHRPLLPHPFPHARRYGRAGADRRQSPRDVVDLLVEGQHGQPAQGVLCEQVEGQPRVERQDRRESAQGHGEDGRDHGRQRHL
ncbi:hypothetical protein DFJ74DRAFT_688186 [Hyaloraphidium curvatum]|nr:hypothetical protein DFJ74DRAFT_688186 [Hyaloraphidium curvatum]